MGRHDKSSAIIDGTVDHIEEAKKSALALLGEDKNIDFLSSFESESLEVIESNIKRLSEYSDKCWLLSSIMLYSLVYDKNMYTQSGLSWQEYVHESKKRLNMDRNEMAERLSASRFFIKHHKDLIKAGWTANSSNRKLSRAEYALELCGSEKEVIKHLAENTWTEFKEWYSTFKLEPALPQPTEYARKDISITKKNGVTINGVKAISISDELPEQDRIRFEKYIEQVFSAIRDGYEPAIVPVYDEKEANNLLRLRDKYRAGKK